MADNALAVQITADIAQFVTALNQATARIEDASKAMTGSNDRVRASSEGATQAQVGLTQSVQNSIREYAAGAAAGLTIANAIEKIGEYAKEAAKWVYDSAEAVNSLSEKFKELRVTTGESLDSLNELYGAAQMSGQGVELVESLMAGWTKGIKSNSDVLIANGVAANKAALEGMSFKEYLLKVYEISQEMKTPAEANVFLTEALGRSGAQAAPKLKELAENLETGTEALKTGNVVTLERLEMQEREEKATGALGLAYQKLYASIGDGVNKVKVPLKEVLGLVALNKVAQDDVKKALEAGIITTEHWYDSLGKLAGKLAETLERFKQVAAEATKVAQNSMDVGAGDGARRSRSLVEPDKKDKPKTGGGGSKSTYVDTEALSQIEMIEWVERYRKQKAEEREREEKRQASERERLSREEEARQKQAAEEEKRLAKEVQAAWERDTVGGGIFAYLREARQAMSQWGTFVKSMLQGVEQSFARGIQGILSGQMSLSKGLKTIWKGIADTIAGALAQMAAKWVVAAIASKLFAKASKQGAEEEAIGKQQAAAAGIFNAHAYIPFVGPAIAAGLIAMMNATLIANTAAAKGIVANAKGSLVTSPTLALIGEAGENEVVAPETAFQDWAGNLTSNIIANQARVNAYHMQGAGYASAAAAAGGVPVPIDLRGAVIAGESAESARLIGDLIWKQLQGRERRRG